MQDIRAAKTGTSECLEALAGPIIIYEAKQPLSEAQRFMAFLTAPVKGDADSRRFGLLPVRFMARTALDARRLAINFWKDETAKAKAMRERGRKLGLARRKSPLPGQPSLFDPVAIQTHDPVQNGQSISTTEET